MKRKYETLEQYRSNWHSMANSTHPHWWGQAIESGLHLDTFIQARYKKYCRRYKAVPQTGRGERAEFKKLWEVLKRDLECYDAFELLLKRDVKAACELAYTTGKATEAAQARGRRNWATTGWLQPELATLWRPPGGTCVI